MTQSIEELAEKRRKWVEANRENGFEVGIKRLLTDLYPDNAHFIYELLQNAEDAHAQEVRFFLHENCIEFEHDGKRLFTIQDVDAITSIGFSTKRDDATNIGKFGVGFKAVFAYTNTPEIQSSEFYFRIRDMVVPEQVSLSEHVVTNGQTRFILPFNNPRKPSKQAMSEIEKLLKALDATTLLFLTYIRKIEYLLPDSSLGYIERIELGGNRFDIRVQQPNKLVPSSTFLKFDKEVQVEDAEAGNEDHRQKICRIAVAFAFSQTKPKGITRKGDEGTEVTPQWELTPMEPGRVCIYFPAEKETSNLRFHLHAPFASTVARDSVRDCSGNNALRDHLTTLLAESMREIRDQGLLTVRALALLPNDKDNLPEFYQPLMNRLVEEFQEKNLVPMKRGGHAAAFRVFRSTRAALSNLIDDDDLVMLLGGNYSAPLWVANPPQRNQREDNFLSMLDIEEWTISNLVTSMSKINDATRATWMGGKDGEWHQDLYELLMDYLDSAPKSRYQTAEVIERKNSIKRISLVRCKHGIYRKGSECFFPTDEVESDLKFPRVAKSVLIRGKENNKKVLSFLETIGVRKVDEQVEIEAILKDYYYAPVSKHPDQSKHYSHLRRFIQFLESNPGKLNLFQNAVLFMADGEEDIEWVLPEGAYLDAPYMETGLSEWYDWLGNRADKFPLSSEYAKSGIMPQKLGEFAKTLGASTKLQVERTLINWKHPEWRYLSRNGGDRNTGYGINKNYHIPELTDFLASSSISKSRLIWRTMKDLCGRDKSDFLRACFRRNARHFAEAKSTLVHDLRTAEWVPQENNGKAEFVEPCMAAVEKLPSGFEYQTGWQWLRELEFGKTVEEQRKAQRQIQWEQTEEYKRKKEIVKDLGFESPEEAEEMARLKNENPEEFRQWKKKISARSERPVFPARPVPNPERRQERLSEQLSDAPEKEYEKRERSVRTSSGAIDPTTWLRNQYTNEADQMVCQICREEMPFRKRNGEHYFEKKEVLSRKHLSKEHEAQYLALCPLCAAKYEEFVKNHDDVMINLKKAIINAGGCEVPVSFGDEKTSIHFVATHFQDIKGILTEMD